MPAVITPPAPKPVPGPGITPPVSMAIVADETPVQRQLRLRGGVPTPEQLLAAPEKPKVNRPTKKVVAIPLTLPKVDFGNLERIIQKEAKQAKSKRQIVEDRKKQRRQAERARLTETLTITAPTKEKPKTPEQVTFIKLKKLYLQS